MPAVNRVVDDLRYSLRIVRHSPGLAVIAVVALAMGIGFTTTMFSIVHGATRDLPLALGAVFLALIGLYAVLSFVVTQQTKEFGVRMALGATARDIVRLVLKRGGMELAWGLSFGLLLALVLSRVLAAAIERVPPVGPLVFAATIGTVVAGGLLALWRPLRQAVRLDPAQALRAE